MDTGDAWGRSSSSSSRRLQSRYDLYMGFDDVDAAVGGEDVEARGAEAYNCPFCGEDFDFVAFCCHIDDEHAVEAKSGVCPICATRVGMDLIGNMQGCKFGKRPTDGMENASREDPSDPNPTLALPSPPPQLPPPPSFRVFSDHATLVS
ncbi:hypothetical protein GUJ93_ZPchr0005g15788 [Zizania palustris]|uniref:Di19 zinc-binding domain-containing protein n=1 Tax=Zizania palustris TaxID=103762 RepID=A0A8J5SMV9_ZIZPA|nr:hypothetical protein GUJ93_ZPchr0005g15788 [Zizania palustris]